MSKLEWKGAALLAPVPPALVTTGTAQNPNVCTVAWCGMVCSSPPVTYISLRPERYSYELLAQNGEFVICLPTAAMVRTIDYCGVKSGRDEDKFAACKLTAQPSFRVAPPGIAQSPLCLECKVTDIIKPGSHHMFIASIEAVSVEESLLNDAGKLELSRAGLTTYAHGEYFALGESLGTFGFSVRKKRP